MGQSCRAMEGDVDGRLSLKLEVRPQVYEEGDYPTREMSGLKRKLGEEEA